MEINIEKCEIYEDNIEPHKIAHLAIQGPVDLIKYILDEKEDGPMQKMPDPKVVLERVSYLIEGCFNSIENVSSSVKKILGYLKIIKKIAEKIDVDVFIVFDNDRVNLNTVCKLSNLIIPRPNKNGDRNEENNRPWTVVRRGNNTLFRIPNANGVDYVEVPPISKICISIKGKPRN